MIEEVLILQGAEEDLLSAYIHFEKRNKEDEFYQDLDEKLTFLKQYPEAGRIYFGDFRRVLLKPRFSYGIYYRIDRSRLVVSAIIPLRIDPNRILERLKM